MGCVVGCVVGCEVGFDLHTPAEETKKYPLEHRQARFTGSILNFRTSMSHPEATGGRVTAIQVGTVTASRFARTPVPV